MTLNKQAGRFSTLRREAERGAVMTLVGVLLGGGALLGFAAISMDVGNMMWERRQLQNGADAAVFDLAFICGTAPSPSTTACTEVDAGTKSTLQQRINDNAEDDASSLFDYCAGGKALDTVQLSACPGEDLSTLRGCPAPPTPYSDPTKFSWVEVHSEVDASGSTVLPYSVAQLLTGDSGTSVGACARATWGTPIGASSTTPITISECEWDQASASGTNYAEPPVYNGSTAIGYGGAGQPALPTANEVVLLTQYTADSVVNTCETWNGHDAPGAFSYLGTGSGCNVDAEPPAWVKGDPGSSLPTGCSAPEFSQNLGKVVDIPVHYCMASVTGGATPTGEPPASSHPCGPGGGQAWYYIKGWAQFYVSGYKVGGSQAGNIYGTSENCGVGGSARCLRGWFTTGVISADTVGSPGGTGGFGAIAVVPAG